MGRKEFKYNKKKESLKEIFKKPREGEFIIISQLIGMKANKYDKLKKYGIEKNLKIEYLNLKKMKSIFEKEEEILKRLTNEIVIIKGSNFGKEIKEIQKFLEEEEINNKGILLLTMLIEEKGKYREIVVEDYKKKKIMIETKEEAMIELYKKLKEKILVIGLKLVKILKKKEEKEREVC